MTETRALENAPPLTSAELAGVDYAEDGAAVHGVGPIVAVTAIAVFADVSRFPSAKYMSNYIRLVPSTNQSGGRDSHDRATKRGLAELCSMLCEAAHHARRATQPLNPYFAKLSTKHGDKRAASRGRRIKREASTRS